MGLFILRLAEEGPAFKDGRIQVSPPSPHTQSTQPAMEQGAFTAPTGIPGNHLGPGWCWLHGVSYCVEVQYYRSDCAVCLSKVGDQIVEINSEPTQGITHTRAIELIQAGGTKVLLLLKPGQGLVPDHSEWLRTHTLENIQLHISVLLICVI